MCPRAKFGAVLILAGTLTGWAAPINPQKKNPPSPPGGLTTAVVLKPAQARASISSTTSGCGTKVKMQKIIPGGPLTVPVEVNGFIFAKPAEAKRPSAAVALAQSAKK